MPLQVGDLLQAIHSARSDRMQPGFWESEFSILGRTSAPVVLVLGIHFECTLNTFNELKVIFNAWESKRQIHACVY